MVRIFETCFFVLDRVNGSIVYAKDECLVRQAKIAGPLSRIMDELVHDGDVYHLEKGFHIIQ